MTINIENSSNIWSVNHGAPTFTKTDCFVASTATQQGDLVYIVNIMNL
jgi:hypothetical protein